MSSHGPGQREASEASQSQNVRGIPLRSMQVDPDLHRVLAVFCTKGAPCTEGLLAAPQLTRDGGMMCKQAAEQNKRV